MQLQELHFCFHHAIKSSGCHRESEHIVAMFLSLDILICVLLRVSFLHCYKLRQDLKMPEEASGFGYDGVKCWKLGGLPHAAARVAFLFSPCNQELRMS